MSPTPSSPYDLSYPTTTVGGYYYGCDGDVYVKGSYNSSFTVAAANDIIVTGDLTTAHDGSDQPTGPAVMGLVANDFVRVMHGVTPRQNHTEQQCQAASGGGNVSNITNQTLTSPTIDAAILAVSHSWIVDNFDCGARLQNLTINGAIAQYYRGICRHHRNDRLPEGLHLRRSPARHPAAVSVRHRELGLACRPGDPVRPRRKR